MLRASSPVVITSSILWLEDDADMFGFLSIDIERTADMVELTQIERTHQQGHLGSRFREGAGFELINLGVSVRVTATDKIVMGYEE